MSAVRCLIVIALVALGILASQAAHRGASMVAARSVSRGAGTSGHFLGDVDCDSRITTADVLATLKYVGKGVGAADCLGVGDVNCDGVVNAVDGLDELWAVAGLQPPVQPVCTALSDAIATETASQALAGWTLECPVGLPFGGPGPKDSVLIDTSGEWRIAVYCRASAQSGRVAYASQKVVFYRMEDQGLQPLLTLDQPLFTGFNPLFEFLTEKSGLATIADLNGNSTPDVPIVQSALCNGPACSRLRIFELSGQSVDELSIVTPATGLQGEAVPYRLVDLDADGKYEVLAFDDSWTYHGFCHACSPGAFFVLGWDGQRWSDDSRDPLYRSYYDEQIARLESSVQQTPDGSPRLSLAISIALNYGHSGRADMAWQRFNEITSTITDPCVVNALPEFEHDLQLSVPKDGSIPQSSQPGLNLPLC